MVGFTRSSPRKHHGARDGAILGALGGHEAHNGHTGRDAFVGGVGGHVIESHREKKAARKVRSRRGVGTSGGVATTSTSTTAAHRAPLGDRIAGKAKVAMGKVTKNRGLVTRGEIEQTYGKGGVAAAGLGPTGAGTSSRRVVY